MKIALAFFDSVEPINGRISPDSLLWSEMAGLEVSRETEDLAVAVRLAESERTIRDEADAQGLLEKLQRASLWTAELVLDRAYRENASVVVLSGFVASVELTKALSRFTNRMGIAAVSPFDSVLATQLGALEYDGVASLASTRRVIVLESPTQPLSLKSDTERVHIGLEGDLDVSLSVLPDNRAPHIVLRIRSVGTDDGVEVRAAGVFAPVIEVRKVPSLAAPSTLAFTDFVQRMLVVELSDQGLDLEAIDEILVVPRSLDDDLTVCADEIATGLPNESTRRRLSEMVNVSAAPALVRHLASGLLATSERPRSRDATILFVPQRVFSCEECLYTALSAVRRALGKRRDVSREVRTAVDNRMSVLAPVVFPSLVDARDIKRLDSEEYEWAFYAVLGQFDPERAKETLPRQLDMLRVLADMADPSLEILYVTSTHIDKSTELPDNRFEIVIRYPRTGDEAVASERLAKGKALGQIVHSLFRDVYSVTYGDSGALTRESRWASVSPQDRGMVSLRWRPSGNLQRWPDWGMIFGVTHELREDTVITVRARAAGSPASIDDGSPTEKRLRPDPADHARGFELEITLEAACSSLDALVTLLAIEFDLLPEGETGPLLTPTSVLRHFHPPFGKLPAPYERRGPNLRLLVEPKTFPAAGLELGAVEARLPQSDRREVARLVMKDRLRHTYIVGKTGTGKTNLLKHLVGQDIAVPGRGLAVIDPHGELVDHAVSVAPRERVEAGEIILLDFSRRDYLPVLNPFYPEMSIDERDRVIQTVLKLLRERIYHEFTGPRFEEMIRMCLLTALHSRYPGIGSLVAVPRLLTDADHRKQVVNHIDDPAVRKRWAFHDLQRNDRDYASTLDWAVSKFSDLVEDQTLRLTLGGGARSVNYEEIISGNRVLLVKLPEATVGPDAAQFLGALIVAQLRLAAFGRGNVADRSDGYLVYLDEFQKFTSTDIARLVAEARKFGLGFVLAHQNLEQLREFSSYSGRTDESLFAAVMGNVANIIVFRTGVLDSGRFSQQLGLRDGQLERLGRFEAVSRVTVDGKEVGPFTLSPPLVTTTLNPRNTETLATQMSGIGGAWRPFESLEALTATLPDVSDKKASGENPVLGGALIRDSAEDTRKSLPGGIPPNEAGPRDILAPGAELTFLETWRARREQLRPKTGADDAPVARPERK